MAASPGMRRLLALAALASASSVPAGEDSTSLIQVTTKKKSMPDSCKCKNWADVYNIEGLIPGVGGPELRGAVAFQATEQETVEYSEWYADLNASWCANMWLNESMDQWCYVSSDCPDLNNGERGDGISWKYCTPGEDEMLNQLTALEVYRAGVREGRDIHRHMKLTLPWAPKNVLWGMFRGFFSSGAPSSKIEKTALQYLTHLRERRTPFVVERLERICPFGIVEGHTAWEMRRSSRWFNLMINKADHFEKTQTMLVKNRDRHHWLVCTGGCEIAEKTELPTLRKIITGLPGEDPLGEVVELDKVYDIEFENHEKKSEEDNWEHW